MGKRCRMKCTLMNLYQYINSTGNAYVIFSFHPPLLIKVVSTAESTGLAQFWEINQTISIALRRLKGHFCFVLLKVTGLAWLAGREKPLITWHRRRNVYKPIQKIPLFYVIFVTLWKLLYKGQISSKEVNIFQVHSRHQGKMLKMCI